MIKEKTLTKLKQYLADYGWGTEEENIIELITEASVVELDPELDSYRWYTVQETVTTPIPDVYIKFARYVITGDLGMGDMDLEYSLADFIEVIPEEKIIKTIIYKEI